VSNESKGKTRLIQKFSYRFRLFVISKKNSTDSNILNSFFVSTFRLQELKFSVGNSELDETSWIARLCAGVQQVEEEVRKTFKKFPSLLQLLSG
jgi:hypothetical protein